MYTVRQLSALAGVSVRTLHYYDEINLFKPTQVGANGYRFYDDQSLLRLQQILFYREIGLELTQIRAVLDNPTFDLVTALRSHRATLRQRSERLDQLVETIDETINHLTGAVNMSKKGLFKGFSAEKQQHYERLARLEYGPTLVNESVKRWNSYSGEKQDAVMQEASRIYLDLVEAMEDKQAPGSPTVTAILERWHDNLRNFYEPTLDVLRGLGERYNDSPDFNATFRKIHPDLPPYLQLVITQYVDDLEHAELVRLLAEDEATNSRDSHAG